MAQKIKDLLLLIKQERKFQVMLGFVVIALLFLVFGPGKRQQVTGRVRLAANQGKEGVTINNLAKESYTDLIQTIKRTSEDNKDAIKGLSDEVRKVKDQQQDYEKTTTAIFGKIIEKLNDQNQPGSAAGGGSMAGVEGYTPIEGAGGQALVDQQDGSGMATNVSANLGTLDAWQTDLAPAIQPQGPHNPRRVAVVTSGDSVRVKLLSGVHAPTDGTPYPVVFKLLGDVSGPNNSILPLGEARLVAAAQGSLTDSRALFRLTKLSIAYPNGRRRAIEVDGWVVGEDGMRGMEGRLLDPIGKALGAGILIGTVQGLGDAVASKNVTQDTNIYGGSQITVSGDELQYAAGRGIAEGADRYGRILDERIKRLVPHVEILSGREATAVFAKDFTIPELMEELDADEASYSSVD